MTYNGYDFARRCIAAVLRNNYPAYEIVLVDNGSTDGTVNRITDEFGDRVRIVALTQNLGPAAARNHGAEIARGDFIATLDNDTEPEADWLVHGIARMTDDPRIGALQCRLMLNQDRKRFDYVGDYLGTCGFLIQPVRTGEIDVGQADEERVILSAKSAGMIFRRAAFAKVGKFDEDYFIYLEETDLCLRMWIAGYTVLYLPTSVVYHEFSSSRSAVSSEAHTRLVRFHGSKNYVATLLKSLELATLTRILPLHLSLWLTWAALNALRGKYRSALWIYAGLWWNILNLSRTLSKRRAVQAFRVLSDAELLRRVGRRDSLSNLLGKTKPVETTPGTFKAHRV